MCGTTKIALTYISHFSQRWVVRERAYMNNDNKDFKVMLKV